MSATPMLSVTKPNRHTQRRDLPWFKGDAADAAITSLWAAADQLGGVDGQFLKCLILTGKRKSALAEMRWNEIDRDWFWHPPMGRKNKRLHPVPLSSLVQRILHPRQTEGYVF